MIPLSNHHYHHHSDYNNGGYPPDDIECVMEMVTLKQRPPRKNRDGQTHRHRHSGSSSSRHNSHSSSSSSRNFAFVHSRQLGLSDLELELEAAASFAPASTSAAPSNLAALCWLSRSTIASQRLMKKLSTSKTSLLFKSYVRLQFDLSQYLVVDLFCSSGLKFNADQLSCSLVPSRSSYHG